MLASASYLILLTLPVWAQHHSSWLAGSGGGVAAHFSGSMLAGNPSHNFGGGLRGNGSGYSHGNYRYGHEFSRHSGVSYRSGRTDSDHRGTGTDSHHRRSYHHERFRGRYSYGNYYPYYGWYGYPYYLSDYGESRYQNQNEDDSAEEDSARYYPAPPRENGDGGLHRDVETLSGKIDRLQADLEARNRPKPVQEVATALVFRDQHVLEVRNYAISGGTLWVLNDQASKKIPLAQLDLDATVKMNDDRGVDFQVPK